MDGYFKHSRQLLQQTARDKRLTAADRQILDVAMLYTRNPGLPVGLGIDFLIAESQLAHRTVIRARRHLAELGYLILGDSGKRGLSCFIVATGATGNNCTGATDDTPTNPRGATEDTGTGATGDTGTSVMDGTQLETGNIETTTYVQNDKKPPSCSAPPEGQNSAPKVAPKKQHPGDLDADAEKLVALYAELAKPKSQDDSGSRKTFITTARRLLSEGKPFSDLEHCIRNYAASRKRREKQPEEVQYRWGFQTFFGPKNEHWRDYLAVEPKSTAQASSNVLSRDTERDADPLWLQYRVEQVEAKYGEDVARRYDAIGRERKSIDAADEWLKTELACRTA